jgi:TIGR03009 family protein
MKPISFALFALFAGVTITNGQQPVPAAAAPVPAADPKLDAHLAQWEKTMSAVKNFHFELELKRTDATFKAVKQYSGIMLCMKPNLARMRLIYDGDQSGADYEAYICNGKAVYEYNGLAKTVTEWKLPDPKKPAAGVTDNLMLDILAGMKAKEARARFELSLFRENKDFVYIDVKPLLPRDKAEFVQLRLALCAPKTDWPYLPGGIVIAKPNGDTETWRIKKALTNIPDIGADRFQYEEVQGFKVQQGVPPTPASPPAGKPGQPVLPGANGLPAGPGTVRP